MAKQPLKLDKYARDARAWRTWGKHNYMASSYLFESHDRHLIFAAATLGHHALEMFLKAALICEGMTIFNPRKLGQLDRSVMLDKKDCAWDHNLVVLAQQLAAKRSGFDLTEKIDVVIPWHVPTRTMCVVPTLEQAFELFDPFFSELRYPQELTMGGVREDVRIVLTKLIKRLEPLLAKIK